MTSARPYVYRKYWGNITYDSAESHMLVAKIEFYKHTNPPDLRMNFKIHHLIIHITHYQMKKKLCTLYPSAFNRNQFFCPDCGGDHQ